MLELHIGLTKVSPTHHRFQYSRNDGTGESIELETKTFLFHDLLHFAVEIEAGLHDSFYGLLAKSKNYTSLSKPLDSQSFSSDEIGVTERVVGGLTGFLKSGTEPDHFISIMQSMFDATDEPLPNWLTPEFVSQVQERMRKLLGEWNGTPFGETMRLRIELS